MFHVEHYLLPLCVCLSWAGAEEAASISSLSQDSPLPTETAEKTEGESKTAALPHGASAYPLATASALPAACEALQAALQDYFLAWNEAALLHFEEALKADHSSALAQAGRLLLAHGRMQPEERQAARANLEKALPSCTALDLLYINVFLKQLAGEQDGALRDFADYSGRYRRDRMAAAWQALLLHYSMPPYDEVGRASAAQLQALEICKRLVAEDAQQPLLLYARALMEESAPKPSQEALAAACRAAELLPWHPMPARLYGHLLQRAGRPDEAAAALQASAKAARALAPTLGQNLCRRLELEAELYEATSLYCAGRDKESLALRRRLNAAPENADNWEIATLPLRLLVCRRPVPDRSALQAAVTVATPKRKPADAEERRRIDTYSELRAILVYVVSARISKAQGQAKAALPLLDKAAALLAEMEQDKSRLFSPRYLKACRLAIYAGRAELSENTAEIWQEDFRLANTAESFLMPPLIPQRLGGQGGRAEEKPAKTASKRKGNARTTAPRSSSTTRKKKKN